ncbi:FAD-dependent oxidoreductase [Fibrivirga algicola]|uniref:FAD-dependent oxidoreductase n=1 Tax=Fibrivirga algicola TaxID=2950420 RepID=A0ABX0QAR2_9BACT|nr:FAD-dependent oxidoreductase [Fibrivirga algicola]NID09350.1 FAD-dependent oxidoreductase [Fibrivirga algicola]
MSDVIVIGAGNIGSEIRFACSLAGLTVFEMLSEEIAAIERQRYYEQIEQIEIKFAQLTRLEKECYDVADYFREPPPTAPRKMGKPTSAKGKSQYLSRKILPCNRKS